MTARPVTTTDLWKLVGLLLVLIDHWGLLFADDPSWRVVGRAAAPIFFFFIGLARTRRVPWSWVVLGLVLTAVESWTSGTAQPRRYSNTASTTPKAQCWPASSPRSPWR